MREFNLLPWRSELREKRKREYLTLLGTSAITSLIIIALIHWVYFLKLQNQNERNDFLNNQIKILERQIVEINELEKKRENLIARMTTVEELQTSRHMTVKLFDEISRTIPDGVYLTDMNYKLDKSSQDIEDIKVDASITGIAQSNARVSHLMRNIKSSDWLSEPVLKVIETKSKEGKRQSEFILTFKVKTPEGTK